MLQPIKYLDLVPRPNNPKRNTRLYQCKCDCGNIKNYTVLQLSSKNLTNCGCNLRTGGYGTINFKGYGDLNLTMFNRIKKRAIKKKIPFKITIKQAWELFLKQERKCSLTGLELTFPKIISQPETGTASLDRKNSSKGYEKGNIQWVHKKINLLKMDLEQNELYRICKTIYLHNKKEIDKLQDKPLDGILIKRLRKNYVQQP